MNLEKNYISFLNTIKSKILQARIRAYRGLNRGHIQLYWDLGKTIVERQKRYGWGQSVVERLSKDLQFEFKGREGYSSHNLWRMRDFYLEYKENPKLARLVLEIPWGHNVLILQKIKSNEQKQYYIEACIKLGWSRDVLLNQVKANAYALAKQRQYANVS